MKVESQYSLLELNTLAINSKAQYAVKASDTTEVLAALEFHV